MRALEAVLLGGEVITFLLLAIARTRATRWALWAALATIIVAAVQATVEGYRWQMVPAYAMAALLMAGALLALQGLGGRSLSRRLAAGAGLALMAVGLAVAIVVPVAIPMFSFATPTGPYGIGTLTYHWVDTARADFGDPSSPRELMVQLWYPTDPSATDEHDTYIQDDMQFGTLPGTPFPGAFSNHLKSVRTHAIKGAPMAGNGRLPVLIFSPGAEGFRQHNTFEVEELVSHGYIVAGIDHPRAAREVVFPDGRRVEFDPKLVDVPGFLRDPAAGAATFAYLAGDVSFAIDQLTGLDRADPNGIVAGRLGTSRLGMFGVSLGGLVTADACARDPRIRACLIMDVFVPNDVVATGLAQPTMWLTRGGADMQAEGWPDYVTNLHQTTMRTAFERNRADAYFVEVPGMFHLNYTDLPYTIATPIARALGLIGPIDWHRGHMIINDYTRAFFDRYLREEPVPLLEGPSPAYPEITLEAQHAGDN